MIWNILDWAIALASRCDVAGGSHSSCAPLLLGAAKGDCGYGSRLFVATALTLSSRYYTVCIGVSHVLFYDLFLSPDYNYMKNLLMVTKH